MFEMLLKCIGVVSKLRPVKVAVLKDLGRAPVDGDFINLSRGQEVDLPRWLGEVLLRLNYVELRQQVLSIDDVSKYLMSEKGLSKSSLTKLREDFYYQIKELLSKSRSSLISVDSAIGVIRLESNIRDLIRLRVNKIVSIALLGAKVDKFEDNLTSEELLLFRLLNELINSWVNNLIKGVGEHH